LLEKLRALADGKRESFIQDGFELLPAFGTHLGVRCQVSGIRGFGFGIGKTKAPRD
jgi:hypothetical protein